jgi:predicted nucleic-acid-binding protein
LKLLDTEVFFIEELGSVRKAIDLARANKGSFADYLIGEINLARLQCHGDFRP